MKIHELNSVYREAAKYAVKTQAPQGNIHNIPGVIGIGTGDGHVKVKIDKRHPLPTKLGATGIPVIFEDRDRPTSEGVVNFGGKIVANYTRSAIKFDQNNHLDASIARKAPGTPYDLT
jgi:hypothetical protein